VWRHRWCWEGQYLRSSLTRTVPLFQQAQEKAQEELAAMEAEKMVITDWTTGMPGIDMSVEASMEKLKTMLMLTQQVITPLTPADAE
jgi:hypothetical protein